MNRTWGNDYMQKLKHQTSLVTDDCQHKATKGIHSVPHNSKF